MKKTSPGRIRWWGILLALLPVSCADLRDARDHEQRRQRFAEEGVILPRQAPLPPVPVF